MSGWDLKAGELLETNVSEEELWSLFNYVFSDACRKTNTYKFGLIKSICDQIYDLSDDGNGYFLPYEKVFDKFAENYWNLVNRYKLKQMLFNGKSDISKVEKIIKEAVRESDIPENISYQSLEISERKTIIRTVTTECKKNVIGALYNDFEGKLYAFDLKGNGLFLSHAAYYFISKYKMEIERLNYYAWARFLEKINDDDALVRILDKLELATPHRKDLSLYRDVLYKEFEEDHCFYCGKKLNNEIHVDHFIPWTFVKNDNLWNFVLACPRCNLKKKDGLVGEEFVAKIERRNNDVLKIKQDLLVHDVFVQNEFRDYRVGLLNRMWAYAKLSGIRECKWNWS